MFPSHLVRHPHNPRFACEAQLVFLQLSENSGALLWSPRETYDKDIVLWVSQSGTWSDLKWTTGAQHDKGLEEAVKIDHP